MFLLIILISYYNFYKHFIAMNHGTISHPGAETKAFHILEQLEH